jgi:uncharacterized protein YceK
MRVLDRSILACVLIAGSVSVVSPSLAAPNDAADSEYARTTAAAVDEFGRGNFAEALVLFEDVYRRRPSARVLRGIAKCAFELHRYARSIEASDAALASNVDPLDADLRADVINLRQRALRFSALARFDVTKSTSGAPPEITVDGRMLSHADVAGGVRLDIGDHVVEATWPASPPLRRVVQVLGESETRIRLAPPVPTSEPTKTEGAPPSNTRRVVGWALGGVGAAALIGSFVLDTVVVPNKLDEFERLRNTDNPAASDSLSSARTMQTVTLVGYGVATGLLLAGAALVLWPRQSTTAH